MQTKDQDQVIQHNIVRWQAEQAARKKEIQRRTKVARERATFKRKFNVVMEEVT